MREPAIRCTQFGDCAERPVIMIRSDWGADWALCDEHANHAEMCWPLTARRTPLLRDPRIACIVVGALTGATPHDRAAWTRVQAILREAWSLPEEAEAQRRDTVAIALDAIEEAGLHEPEAWPRVRHTHQWFARGRTSSGPSGITIPLSGRCTCGAREIDEVGLRAIESELARRMDGSHRFRYADGRVEWLDAPEDAAGEVFIQELATARDGSRSLVVEHAFHLVRFREPGWPDVFEYHERTGDRPTRSWLIGNAWDTIRRERDALRTRRGPLASGPR